MAHAILTRFNLPSAGVEGTIRAKDGWLRDRLALFERYTIPAIRSQLDRDFRWLVYFDPESPWWLRDAIDRHQSEGTYQPLFRESVPRGQLTRDLAEHLPATPLLMTTNLDNDDSIARDFTARLHALGSVSAPRAVFFSRGLVRQGDDVYAWTDRHNAFCTVVEPWSSEPKTCWLDWHNLMPTRMSTQVLGGAPAWLQVVHGGNVSNRVRGVVIDPAPYRELFGDGLDQARTPSLTRRLSDRIVRNPVRQARDGIRSVGKALILQTVGKDGLDRVKMVRSQFQRGAN